MNVFNRIVVVLLTLVLLALVALMFISPTQVMDTVAATVTRAQESVLFSDAAWNTYYRAGLAAITLLLLILLISEVRKTRKKSVRIKTDGKGKARIGVESVTQSLAFRIDELPGVRDAKPRITSRGNDVSVAIDLHTSPTVNVPSITAQIVNLAHEIIESQLGVKIHGKVEVNVAHEPYPRGTLAPATPPKGQAPARPSPEPTIPAATRPAAPPATDKREVQAEPRPNGK